MSLIQLMGQGGLRPAPDANSSYLVTAFPFAPFSGFTDQSHIIRGSGSLTTVTDSGLAYQPSHTISTDEYKFYGASYKKPFDTPADPTFHSAEFVVDTGVANTIGTQNFCYECWYYTENFTWDGATQMTLLYSANATSSYGPTYTWKDCPSILIGSDSFPVPAARRGLRIYQQPNDTALYDTGPCLSPNTWHHIAVTRSGTTSRTFVDGILRASGTDSKSYTGYEQHHLASLNRTLTFGMYAQDVRFYVGTAKYTSNFTPPGAMFI